MMPEKAKIPPRSTNILPKCGNLMRMMPDKIKMTPDNAKMLAKFDDLMKMTPENVKLTSRNTKMMPKCDDITKMPRWGWSVPALCYTTVQCRTSGRGGHTSHGGVCQNATTL